MTSYTLRGITLPGRDGQRRARRAATRTASPPTRPATWSAEVDLRRGRNQFDVSALDPETGKHSEETVRLYITVPFLVTEAPTLTRRPAGRGRDVRERRDPRPGARRRTRRRSS